MWEWLQANYSVAAFRAFLIFLPMNWLISIAPSLLSSGSGVDTSMEQFFSRKHQGESWAVHWSVDRPARGEWPETGLPETNGVWSFREVVLTPFMGWWQRFAGSFK